mmetsp:Transcript_10621/g.12238  ORF Transcript_10621/g.12238 Transcript_10621/m.12238 type:complete len:217 (-) Transcript_10621:11-661(-)
MSSFSFEFAMCFSRLHAVTKQEATSWETFVIPTDPGSTACITITSMLPLLWMSSKIESVQVTNTAQATFDIVQMPLSPVLTGMNPSSRISSTSVATESLCDIVSIVLNLLLQLRSVIPTSDNKGRNSFITLKGLSGRAKPYSMNSIELAHSPYVLKISFPDLTSFSAVRTILEVLSTFPTSISGFKCSSMAFGLTSVFDSSSLPSIARSKLRTEIL